MYPPCNRKRARATRTHLTSALLLCALAPMPVWAQGEAESVSVKHSGKALELQLGGFLQVQAELGQKGDARFTTGNDRIYLRRARFGATGKLKHRFDFRLDLEGAAIVKETTDTKVNVIDAYFNWTHGAWLKLRAGQFKTPFGMEFNASDTRLYTVERSLGGDRLTMGRQLGVQAFGDLVADRCSYAIGMFNGTPGNSNRNDGENFMFAGNVSGAPWVGQLLGRDARWSLGGSLFSDANAVATDVPSEFGFNAAGTTPPDKVFAGDRAGFGVDSQLKAGSLELWGELLALQLNPDNDVPRDRVDASSYFVLASYGLSRRHLRAVVRYDRFDPNADKADDDTRTWTFGLNWEINGVDLIWLNDYMVVTGYGTETPGSDDKVLSRFQLIF